MSLIQRHIKKFTTTQIIAFGFLSGIVLGSFLLTLPIASRSGESTNLLDAVFTATTSICVTGLTTLNILEHWSMFGQVVILCLIQFGGLGIVTFTTIVLLVLRKRITLKERMLIQEAYNLSTLRGLVKLTIQIIKGTLCIELVGAILTSTLLIPRFGFWQGIWKSIFHSISSFCNAGMDVIGASSLAEYRGNLLMNVVTMTLIILGGIGFPVWWDILDRVKKAHQKKAGFKKGLRSLRLQTKLVLVTTFLLIFVGALGIFLTECNNPNTLKGIPFGEKVMASFFQSVTTRTAGFFTIPQENLTDNSSFFSIILMFIGGSPSGTAGGVKTITVAMIALAAWSMIRGKKDTEAFGRKIDDSFLKRGLTVIVVNITVMFVSTTALSFVESFSFMDVLYEVSSALGTVGLSRNITPYLSEIGKAIIVMTMYLGRIGPITMALAFNTRREKSSCGTLSGEDISVG